MAWCKLESRIRGSVPLLMHSGQLANPLSEISKQIKKVSGKRAKTEADHAEMARLEWLGSLYLRDGRPCLPGVNLEKALVEAARKRKMGKQAMAGILCSEDALLEYDGPHDPKQLWELPGFRLVVGVKVQMAKVMRTRPKFSDWAANVVIQYDPAQLNEEDVRELLVVAGETIGIGDWRPKFGRFEVVE